MSQETGPTPGAAADDGASGAPDHPRLRRRSPVRLPGTAADVEERDGWKVVVAYEDEGRGPWLVDLSHRARWDYQDRRIDEHRPFGLDVPSAPGEVGAAGGLMIQRMNGTQASIWHVGPQRAPRTPPGVGYTQTTDSHAWLAVIGEATPDVMERITALDLFPPGIVGPRLVQGPVLGVPCQIVVVDRRRVLITVSRGYGQTFADAVLEAARDVGLGPGGEAVFARAGEGSA